MQRSRQGVFGPKKAVAAIVALGRMSEWWEYKFVPALLVGYATSILSGSSPWAAATALAMLLCALLPGGVFVSVLNDLTDRDDDAAAGKANRQQGKHWSIPILLIACSLAAGLAIMWGWRDDGLLVATYGLGWLAFSLYSLRPFRLKSRGVAGILCDATGAHMVPAALAVLIVSRALHVEVDMPWLCTICAWSLLYGLRGILWHQIDDVSADQKSQTRTFVALYGKEKTIFVVKWFLFPLEIMTLWAFIIQTGILGMAAAGVAFLIYARLVYRRIDQFDMVLTIVEPKPRSCIALHEFYDLLLPIGFLLIGMVHDWETLYILALHCLLFPIRLRQVWQDFRNFSDPQYLTRSARQE